MINAIQNNGKSGLNTSQSPPPTFPFIHQDSTNFTDFHSQSDFAIVHCFVWVVSPSQGMSGYKGGEHYGQFGIGEEIIGIGQRTGQGIVVRSNLSMSQLTVELEKDRV